jgi:hypothetical protein
MLSWVEDDADITTTDKTSAGLKIVVLKHMFTAEDTRGAHARCPCVRVCVCVSVCVYVCLCVCACVRNTARGLLSGACAISAQRRRLSRT